MAEKGQSSNAPLKKLPNNEPEAIPSTSRASNPTRIQRNAAEKQRRDKLNGYISELANIVPMVSMSSKRLDKTSILRLSAAHLRLSKCHLGRKILKGSFNWCPSFLSSEQVRQVLESVDGFLILTSPSGKILFTSQSVERYLGHQNIDMIGHPIFLFIHHEDTDTVKRELEKLLKSTSNSDNSKSRPRCSFYCRMKEKSQPRSEVVTYQRVHFSGLLTIFDNDEPNTNFKSSAIVKDIFEAFCRVVDPTPYSQMSLAEATADEYVTRHNLDGTIIYADPRIATITGHLPKEVQGLSAYDYILPEDSPITLFAQLLMFSGNGNGIIVYRLRTKDDKFVYLKSVGVLQIDSATSQVDHFVCINQQLSDAEGEVQMKYFSERFVPHIKDKATLLETVKALPTTGFKAPSTLGSLHETTFKRPVLNHSEVDTGGAAVQIHKESKPPTVNTSHVFVQPANHPINMIVPKSKSSVSEISRNKKMCVDKGVGTENAVFTVPVGYHKKYGNSINHNKIGNVRNKRKAVCNNTMVTKLSNVNKHGISIQKPSQPDVFQFTLPRVPKNNDLIGASWSLNEPHLPNISIIDGTINNTENNKKERISNEQTNIQSDIFNSHLITNLPQVSGKFNGEIETNLNYIQVPEIPTWNVTDVSFQAISENNVYNGIDQALLNNEYAIKSNVDFTIPNYTNVYSMATENNTDMELNAVISTKPVSYNNDLQIPSMTTNTTVDTLNLGSVPFVVSNIAYSNSHLLSTNVNNIIIEDESLSGETNSKSRASNTVSEETVVTQLELDCNNQNTCYIAEEELNDNLVAPQDITSILNSTLPFDDSSLPSVDGWREFFRPEDILNDPVVDIATNIESCETFVNTVDENELNLW